MRVTFAFASLLAIVVLDYSQAFVPPRDDASSASSNVATGERPAVYINEIQLKNMDWVEIYNEGDGDMDLTGYTLVYDSDKRKAYSFRGDCSTIEAKSYLMLVKDEVINPEYANGDCMLPFGIKASGELALFDSNGVLLDSTSWANTAYVPGHSWARKSGVTEIGKAIWEATSTNTWRRPNIFTEEITIPEVVDFSEGMHDRTLAYVQDPPFGSITNVHLRVHTSSDGCTCEKYNDSTCTCTWEDVQKDASSTDNWVPTLPCSVSIDVDGKKEYGFTASGKPIEYDNCMIRSRGGWSRRAKIKSYNIKISKKVAPREWRGYKKLTLVKHPWSLSRVEVPLLNHQFRDMKDFHAYRTLIANVTVTYLDPKTNKVVDVENLGGYTIFENRDEDMLDRHGLSSQTADGERKESHLYKLRKFVWSHKAIYDDVVPHADRKNETQMTMFERYLENKDSEDNTKLMQTIRELNGMVPGLTFVEAVHKRFDMRNLAQWMAVNLICGDRDHIGKNAYIYSNNDTDMWYYTPWDYDLCFKPVFDHGPPSLTPYRYANDHLFRGIMHYPELRDTFWSLLKEKINYIRTETGFERKRLLKDALKFAKWTDPLVASGQTDRKVLHQRPWGLGSSDHKKFYPENWSWIYKMAPRDLFSNQYDFLQENLDIYTGLDYPPPLYSPIIVQRQGETKIKFDAMTLPLTSPIGNLLEITWQVYAGRPDDLNQAYKDGQLSLWDSTFYDPEKHGAEIVYETSMNNEDHMLYTDMAHVKSHTLEISCDDIRQCADYQCWITLYTTDLVANIRSAGGYSGWRSRHAKLEYTDVC